MMPTFPPPPLSTVRRVFPSTAGRLAFQVAPSLMSLRLSLHQACPAHHVGCIHPSCTPLPHFTSRSVSEQWTRWRTAIRGVNSSTPEVFAPVWVLLSQPIYAYSTSSVPLAGTSRFRRLAVYTGCPRCAGAPRRPASGSVLSLCVPSRHAVLYGHGESIGCTYSVLHR